jgi:hypothetical protein
LNRSKLAVVDSLGFPQKLDFEPNPLSIDCLNAMWGQLHQWSLSGLDSIAKQYEKASMDRHFFCLQFQLPPTKALTCKVVIAIHIQFLLGQLVLTIFEYL